MLNGNDIFQLVTMPENFIKMEGISNLILTTLYRITESHSALIQSQNKPLTSFTKQYINAIIRSLTEYNNAHKVGHKKTVNHTIFPKAKVYNRVQK